MKSSETIPDELADTCKSLSMEDKEIRMKYKDGFVKVSCPACESNDSDFAFVKSDCQFLECNNCKTVYVSPRPTPAVLTEYLEKSKSYEFFAESIFPASEKVRREEIFKPRVDFLLKNCSHLKSQAGVLIEIGAGFGTFCVEVKSRDVFKNVIAIEPVPGLAKKCRERGLEVIDKPFEQIDLEGNIADVVVSFEAIEHVFDPRDFIKFCTKLLKKEGLLMLTCPNMLGFDVITLGTKSQSVAGGHLNMFNPKSIEILLNDFGLEVVDLSTPGKLDAELVRKRILSGEFEISEQPFLKYILVDHWQTYMESFQKWLVDSQLSSHLQVVARKR